MANRVVFKKLPENKLSKREIKDFNIEIGELERKAIKASKGECCLICGKPCSSFCSSHSIPKFVLRGISTKGLILRGMDFIKTTGIIKPTGVGSVLTFSSICNDCDNTFFKEYESPDAFKKHLSPLAINEIAIKNYLRYVFKRKKELFQFKLLLEKMDEKGIYDISLHRSVENKLLLSRIDVEEYETSLKMLLRKRDEDYFYVIDEINLDYNTHFAYQGFVALINGFDDKIINDTFNYDTRYKMQRLGVAVFPFENSTKIVLFCKHGSTRLRSFYKTFLKLSLEEKLYAINYLLLINEEEWCVPASFDRKVLNKQTMDLIKQTQDVEFRTDNPFPSDKEVHDAIRANLGDRYVIQTKGNIYNFLAKQKEK